MEQLKSEAMMNAMNFDEVQREADAFILDSAAAIVVNDETGKIIRVTREVEDNLNYLQNELLGQTLEVLIPQRLRDVHVQHRTGQAGFSAARQMAFGRTVTALTKDGREREVVISLKSKFVVNKATGEKERWTRAKIIFSPMQ